LGKQIVRLTIIGHKSGQPRSVLLYAFPAGDSYAVVASNLGDDAYPFWYLNLKANPALTVEIEGRRFEGVAREAEGEERSRLWAGVTAADPTYTEYQKRTERVIPVIVLEVRENPTGAD
jgi:deazaflavin-dependent oxidoreductase (nitroreductase family)